MYGIVRAAALAVVLSIACASGPWPAFQAAAEEAACRLRSADFVRSTSSGADCVVCHDGTVAGAAEIDTHTSHRFDVQYDKARLAKPLIVLRFAADLPAAVVLADGNVVCATCHDGASTQPRHTALPTTRGELCRACHAR